MYHWINSFIWVQNVLFMNASFIAIFLSCKRKPRTHLSFWTWYFHIVLLSSYFRRISLTSVTLLLLILGLDYVQELLFFFSSYFLLHCYRDWGRDEPDGEVKETQLLWIAGCFGWEFSKLTAIILLDFSEVLILLNFLSFLKLFLIDCTAPFICLY